MSLVRRLSKSQLVRGSLFIFIGSNLVSFGNFLYNLFMGRLLGPELYGDLGAIFSLLVLMGTPLSIISLILVKKNSSYWGRGDKSAIKTLIIYLTPRFFCVGILVSLILFLVSPVFLNNLNLNSYLPVLIFSAYFILNFPVTLNCSVLQGTLSFPYFALNGFVEISLKLVISIILVIFNFQLVGALLGPLIGMLAGYILTYFELKLILRGGETRPVKLPSIKRLFAPSLPIFLAILSMTMFISVDIILVRYFFTPREAGEYVALSTIGKIIYFAIGPIISVMFPTISSRVSSGSSYILPLLGTLILSLVISVVLIFAYFLFPHLIISILFGEKYFAIIPYLGTFSFFISIYAIDAIFTYFLLSISFYQPVYLLFLISLLQGILIFLFHQSITHIIWINIAVSSFYLLTAFSFVWSKERKIIMKVFSRALFRNIYGG